jgi:hypothetical protein
VKLLSVAALAIALVAAGLAQAQPARKPILRLVDTAPLTVRGLYFEHGERVRVQVRGALTLTRRVRTSARGAFTVVFKAADLSGCDAFVVTARGTKGDQAYLKLAPMECNPP